VVPESDANKEDICSQFELADASCAELACLLDVIEEDVSNTSEKSGSAGID
jgi:hypothetical protein